MCSFGFVLFVVRNSGSPMLGERNRVCDEVGWDLVEATSSPSYTNNNNNSNNNGAHPSNWTGSGNGGGNGGPGSGARTELNTRNASCISRVSRNSRDDDEEDFDDATNIQYGGDAIGGENMSVNGGNAGKEVRYAPLPLGAQSPTHSNQINQASLQRTHSRYAVDHVDIQFDLRITCCGPGWASQASQPTTFANLCETFAFSSSTRVLL